MSFLSNILLVTVFFPLWVSVFIFCNINFFSINSKKLTLAFTLLSSLLMFSIGAYSQVTGSAVDNNFLVLAINDINFYFGMLINNINSAFVLILGLMSGVLACFAYKNFKDEDFYFKYFMMFNLVQFCIFNFFISTNLIQMFVFFTLAPILFYITENMVNYENHERAKNFLVLNKLGDFCLLVSISVVLYFAIAYNYSSDIIFLNINELVNLFGSIYSITDIGIFSLICIMFILGILIKSVFIFIHPLKLKEERQLLALYGILTATYFFIVLFPAINIEEITRNIILVTIVIIFSCAIFILLTKKLFQNPVFYINKSTVGIAKNIYYFGANIVDFIDTRIINGIYDGIAKLLDFFANIFSNFNTKKTYISFIFNVLGIMVLILIMWILYNWLIKG